MNLATMRTRFKDRCAGLADDLSDDGVDELLNEQYCYAIPDKIPGLLSEGKWTVTTVAGTQGYAYPAYVHSIQRGAIIDDNPLLMYFRHSEMWARYTYSDTTQRKPYAALFTGHGETEAGEMALYPNPDDAYTIVVPARVYPNDGTDLLELTASGLSNTTHALAVISGAAAERFADSGDVDNAAYEQSRLQYYMSRLRTRSVSPPKGRRARRSF